MSKTSTYSAWGVAIACAVGAYIVLKRGRDTIPTLLNNGDMKNYFGDSEFTNSTKAKQLGIKNIPTADDWTRIYALRDNILNPARQQLGYAVYITSGYRSPELNKAVGGAANSQHTTGEAADITTKWRTRNKKLFAILAQLGNFDQLIWEKGGEWIHVSYRPGANRGEMLAYDGSSYRNINNNWQTAIA